MPNIVYNVFLLCLKMIKILQGKKSLIRKIRVYYFTRFIILPNYSIYKTYFTCKFTNLKTSTGMKISTFLRNIWGKGDEAIDKKIGLEGNSNRKARFSKSLHQISKFTIYIGRKRKPKIFYHFISLLHRAKQENTHNHHRQENRR